MALNLIVNMNLNTIDIVKKARLRRCSDLGDSQRLLRSGQRCSVAKSRRDRGNTSPVPYYASPAPLMEGKSEAFSAPGQDKPPAAIEARHSRGRDARKRALGAPASQAEGTPQEARRAGVEASRRRSRDATVEARHSRGLKKLRFFRDAVRAPQAASVTTMGTRRPLAGPQSAKKASVEALW